MLETLKSIIDIMFEDEQSVHVFNNIKQSEFQILAFLAIHYGSLIFTGSGRSAVLEGPILKESFGTYIYCDEIFYQEHDSMFSTTGLGYEGGSYYVYIFNDPETDIEKAFKETYTELKNYGLDVSWKRDEGEDADPKDKVIIIEFKNFYGLVEFANGYLESKLS